MTSVTRRILFSNPSVYILNRLYNPQSCIKFVRTSHFLNKEFLLAANSYPKAVITTQNVHNVLRPVDFVPIRHKSNKKKASSHNKEDIDDDDDDDASNLNDFREGDSDRNLAQIKVPTLRLDTVIKAGLGFTKKKTEKLFYESKIRVNGNKITKKSMDILKECEIDVIKGPSPDNSEYLVIGRIEILSVKAEGLNFVLTIRRHKNLVIENYDANARYTDAD